MLSRKQQPESLEQLKVAIRQTTFSRGGFQYGGPNEQASSVYSHEISPNAGSCIIKNVRSAFVVVYNLGDPATHQSHGIIRAITSRTNDFGTFKLKWRGWSHYVRVSIITSRQIETRKRREPSKQLLVS